MKILHSGKADYPELIEIWEASVRATHPFVSEEDIQYFRPLILERYFDAVTLYVVRKDDTGSILGFLGISDKELDMLFLHPDAIGKGIGRLFTQFAIDECGVNKVDINEQNEHALGFYQHMGFKVVSRSELDYLGRPYPLLSMVLD